MAGALEQQTPFDDVAQKNVSVPLDTALQKNATAPRKEAPQKIAIGQPVREAHGAQLNLVEETGTELLCGGEKTSVSVALACGQQ